jgi:hypothetical protein
MRKRWMAIPLFFMATSLIALGPTAQASKQHFWVGHTDKKHIVLFTTETKHGALVFEPIEIDFNVTCRKSGDVVEMGNSFFGFEEPLDGSGHFDLNLGDPYYGPFDWSGTLSGKNASGTVLAGFPLYDGRGGFGTQSCDNDPGTPWSAKDLGGAQLARPDASMHVTYTKDRHGHVHIAVDR